MIANAAKGLYGIHCYVDLIDVRTFTQHAR